MIQPNNWLAGPPLSANNNIQYRGKTKSSPSQNVSNCISFNTLTYLNAQIQAYTNLSFLANNSTWYILHTLKQSNFKHSSYFQTIQHYAFFIVSINSNLCLLHVSKKSNFHALFELTQSIIIFHVWLHTLQYTLVLNSLHSSLLSACSFLNLSTTFSVSVISFPLSLCFSNLSLCHWELHNINIIHVSSGDIYKHRIADGYHLKYKMNKTFGFWVKV